MSLVKGVPRFRAAAKHCPGAVLVKIAGGAAIVGGVVSRTITGKIVTLEIPNASTATQVTKLLPRGNVVPEGGVQVTGTLGWQVFVALAVNETTAPAGLVASAT